MFAGLIVLLRKGLPALSDTYRDAFPYSWGGLTLRIGTRDNTSRVVLDLHLG